MLLVIVKKLLRNVDPIWRKNKAKCRNWKNSLTVRNAPSPNQKKPVKRSTGFFDEICGKFPFQTRIGIRT
jgi:hypothetical protein